MAGEDEGEEQRPEAAPSAGTTDNSVTQSLPTVGPPSVRAVARRPATALPALGGKAGGPEVPLSARVTVDRRRQARAAAESDAETESEAATAAESESEAVEETPDPVDVSAEQPGPAVVSAEEPEPVEVEAGEVELSSSGRHRASDAEVPAGHPDVRETALDVRGPAVLDADYWTEAAEPAPSTDYRGQRRRAIVPRSRLWMIVVVALAVLGGAVAVPWALAPGGSDVAVDPGPTISASDATAERITASPSSVAEPSVSAQAAVGASPPQSSSTPPASPDASAEPSPTASPTPMPTPTLLSRGRPTATSALENGSLAGANAVDGNQSTRWGSAWSDPQWISVDLGKRYSITRVRLSWEAAYGRSYEIQTSVDNTNWTTAFATTNGNGGVDDVSVTGSGRWVRVLGRQRATEWGYSLWELEVFGTAA